MDIHTIITVYPNKWLRLDAQGRPAAIVLKDIGEGGKGFIGAKIVSGVVAHADTAQVRATNYIRDRIRRGELLVDEQTIKALSLYSDTWLPPQKALETARRTAIAEYDAQHGKGAWASNNIPDTSPVDAPKSSKDKGASK